MQAQIDGNASKIKLFIFQRNKFNLRFKIRAQQDVWSLDITMDNAPLADFMKIMQASCHPNCHLVPYCPLQWWAFGTCYKKNAQETYEICHLTTQKRIKNLRLGTNSDINFISNKGYKLNIWTHTEIFWDRYRCWTYSEGGLGGFRTERTGKQDEDHSLYRCPIELLYLDGIHGLWSQAQWENLFPFPQHSPHDCVSLLQWVDHMGVLPCTPLHIHPYPPDSLQTLQYSFRITWLQIWTTLIYFG